MTCYCVCRVQNYPGDAIYTVDVLFVTHDINLANEYLQQEFERLEDEGVWWNDGVRYNGIYFTDEFGAIRYYSIETSRRVML